MAAKPTYQSPRTQHCHRTIFNNIEDMSVVVHQEILQSCLSWEATDGSSPGKCRRRQVVARCGEGNASHALWYGRQEGEEKPAAGQARYGVEVVMEEMPLRER